VQVYDVLLGPFDGASAEVAEHLSYSLLRAGRQVLEGQVELVLARNRPWNGYGRWVARG
jgi:hypothetical protein